MVAKKLSGQSTVAETRGGSLGRDALLALGIGVLLGGTLIGMAFPVQKYTSSDNASVCAILGLIAFASCVLWSCVLSGRAL